VKSTTCYGLIVTLTYLGLATVANAEVRLPALIGNHMVVQRGVSMHLWGTADPAERVSASFQGMTASGVAGDSGAWSIYLPPPKVGGPYSLEIRGNNVIEISDVMVGEVWVASGQSNMELEMAEVTHGQAEIAAANDPEIRLFHVQHTYSDYPLDDLQGASWTACTPQNVKDFSAVGYFFARKIQDDQKVPIGIVESSWGGTPVEAWISLSALAREPKLLPLIEAWAKLSETEAATIRTEAITRKRYDMAKTEANFQPAPPNNSGLHRWAPAYLFNGMIAPLLPMPIRGVIWYQGEHNADPIGAPLYERAFRTMIADWRDHWNQGQFPFLFVQLANFKATIDPGSWEVVRDAQRRTLSLANTGMAVANDIGDPVNIHPADKQDVGARLALAARAIAYNEQIEYSGPLYRSAIAERGLIRVFFDHATGGLTFQGQEAIGFEIAGSDGVYLPAQVAIEGDSVVLSNKLISSPEHARCGWSGSQECDLYNGAGLPAASFISN
jgi:sialate O-acetylesterase